MRDNWQGHLSAFCSWSELQCTITLVKSPLSCPFSASALHCGCSEHHCASALASSLRGMGDCARHQSVVKSVH